MTFQQPLRVPRAEQAQGVQPRLNSQLKKSSASYFQAFISKNQSCLEHRACVNRGQDLSSRLMAVTRGPEQQFPHTKQ